MTANVSNAMRWLSVLPLIEAVPDHIAVGAMMLNIIM